MRVIETDEAIGLRPDFPKNRPAWRRVTHLLQRALTTTRDRRIRRAAACELAGLSDHLLEDVGVRRSDLDAGLHAWLPDLFVIYGPHGYARFWGGEPLQGGSR